MIWFLSSIEQASKQKKLKPVAMLAADAQTVVELVEVGCVERLLLGAA